MKTKEKPRARPAPAAILPPGVNAVLTPAQVCAAIQCSPETLRRLVRNGEFPASESPEGRDPRWRLSTVNGWIDQTYGRREA